jgi:hypothetical protein
MFLLAFFLLPTFALAQSTSSLVPPPSSGLAGVSNYFLQNDGHLLHQVQANISIKDDLVFNETGTTFLLQVFGPLLNNSAAVDYQQIVISVDGANGHLSCSVTSFNSSLKLVDFEIKTMANLTDNTKVPGGTNISMTFNTDSKGLLTSVDFDVSIQGKKLKDKITLKSKTSSAIAALEFNIVGATANGSFTSGSGTVQISSADPITPVNSAPEFVKDIESGAGGNSQYSQMFAGSSKVVAQNFNVS